MTITCALGVRMTVTETLTSDDFTSDRQLVHDGLDYSTSLTGSTTPAVDTSAFTEVTLSGGAATLDLTAVTRADTGGVVSFSGKKIVGIEVRNDAAASMTIAKGASNGFTGFGSAFSLVVPPGGRHVLYFASGGTAVSGSVKTLDISGTGSQVVKIGLVGGP